ncbi:Uncharacterized protein FWK35_00031767 [Aphis craccivora]|uniref:Uncharacterized protein n=1 Tax=Aphis craccivora TaxID=307492 RepID=A0A6G0W4A2_APHCR|nr:Uncharacterized protein FWK35_00031767 [Aphis craccivora]
MQYLSTRIDVFRMILSGAMNVFIFQCCVFFFFFLCLCTRERVEIMLQFQTSRVVSDSKMNLVGALGRSFFEFPNSITSRNNTSISNFGGGFRCKSEYPWCIKEKNKKKKMTEKREFLRKTSFRPNRPNRFFNMVIIQKLITANT